MTRWAWILPLCLALAAFIGCGETAPGPADNGASSPDVAAVEPSPAEDQAPEAINVAEVTLTEGEIAEIKKLPEDEAALALKQKVCPISGEHLGTEAMGTPIKVTAEGKTVFLCCGGCKKMFESDPKTALAKLGLDKAETTQETP